MKRSLHSGPNTHRSTPLGSSFGSCVFCSVNTLAIAFKGLPTASLGMDLGYPETSPFLNGRLEFIWEVPPLMISASLTLAQGLLSPLDSDLRGQAVGMATRGESSVSGDSSGRWGLRAWDGLCVE